MPSRLGAPSASPSTKSTLMGCLSDVLVLPLLNTCTSGLSPSSLPDRDHRVSERRQAPQGAYRNHRPTEVEPALLPDP
jgi:hypothetical protein